MVSPAGALDAERGWRQESCSASISCCGTAPSYTTILESTVLVMLYPILVALGGYLFFREDRSRLGLGGIAFIGLVLMVAGAGDASATGQSRPAGRWLRDGGVLLWGSLLISSRLCRRHDPVAVTFWVMLFAALTALPFGLMEERPFPTGAGGWLYVAGYGAVTLASYSFFNRGLKTVRRRRWPPSSAMASR